MIAATVVECLLIVGMLLWFADLVAEETDVRPAHIIGLMALLLASIVMATHLDDEYSRKSVIQIPVPVTVQLPCRAEKP